MKLTKELKKEIDTFSLGKIVSMFRFFPSDYTTGEAGKYMRDRAREISVNESLKPKRI